MKYYDVSTRKRPEFEMFYNSLTPQNVRNEVFNIPIYGVLCICGDMLFSRHVTFDHWQQGHFDTYDEVKEN